MKPRIAVVRASEVRHAPEALASENGFQRFAQVLHFKGMNSRIAHASLTEIQQWKRALHLVPYSKHKQAEAACMRHQPRNFNCTESGGTKRPLPISSTIYKGLQNDLQNCSQNSLQHSSPTYPPHAGMGGGVHGVGGWGMDFVNRFVNSSINSVVNLCK
jgi:hypothetical protein